MSISQGLLDNESVRSVVGKGIAKRRGLGGALGRVVVADGLDDTTKLAVGVGQP